MRLPILMMLLGATLLGGCVANDTPKGKGANPEVTEQTEPAEKIESPWKLGIESKRDAGAKIQSAGEDSKTLEAAGKWFVVMLSVENTSTDRQSAKNVFATTTAKLIDAAGKSYDVDTDAISIIDDTLDKKPFASGEARSVKLVFDIPKDAKPKHITLLGDDVKGVTRDFTAKL
jgi:Domain of unknown function (DUF4352)